MHPYLNQELSHIATCLYEGERPTITGELIRASLEQLQVEIGLPGYLLQQDYSILHSLATDCWLKTVWSFAWQHEIDIQDTLPKLELNRWNDSYLMEEFVRNGFKGHELRKLNECRMFLEVVNLSEITTVDGKKITPQSWKGVKQKNRLNSIQWPRRQTALSKQHWQIWRRAITLCFMHPMKLKEQELNMPLGPWDRETHSTWTWFYYEEDDQLYKREGLLWYCYEPKTVRRRRTQTRLYERNSTAIREVPMELLQLADITPIDDFIQLISTHPGYVHHPTSSIRSDTSMEVLRQQQPKPDQWAIAEWDHQQSNLPQLVHDIRQGTASAVSDGSYKNDNGTSAFLLCAADVTNCIIGVNAVPGSPSEQSAYRSELAGVSGILLALKILCKKFDITSGSVEIGLDGQQALEAASGNWPLKVHQPDFDLLKDIRAKVKLLPVAITWHWIRGHQDDHEDYHNLDTRAKLNIQADSLAKAFWNHCEKNNKRLPNQDFGNDGWTYRFNHQKRSRLEKKELYAELFGDATRDYWIDKGQIQVQEIHSIDWKNTELAMKRLPFSRQMWLSKHASGHCAVGRMMLMRKKWTHSKCPRCLQDNETNEHVLLCTDVRATEHWEKLSTKLDKDLVSMNTAPELRRTIIRKLNNWRRRRRITAQITNKYGEREASEHQDKIGWTNLMLGRMAPEWAAAQQSYLDWLGRRTTGKRWLIALTVKLLNISWDMWDHRNRILHASTHPWNLLKVHELDLKIDDEYRQGYQNLQRKDYKWLHRTLAATKKLTPEVKQQWLTSIHLSRQTYERNTTAQYQAMRPERSTMIRWLTGVPPRTTENQTEQANGLA